MAATAVFAKEGSPRFVKGPTARKTGLGKVQIEFTVDRETIVTKETIIGGIVRGNVKAPDKVELQTKSQVEGDVVTYSLVVEQGAVFHGNCQMKKGQGARPDQPKPPGSGFKESDTMITPKSTNSTLQKAKA